MHLILGKRSTGLQELLDHMNADRRVVGGAEASQFMALMSLDPMKLTQQLNACSDFARFKFYFQKLPASQYRRRIDNQISAIGIGLSPIVRLSNKRICSLS